MRERVSVVVSQPLAKRAESFRAIACRKEPFPSGEARLRVVRFCITVFRADAQRFSILLERLIVPPERVQLHAKIIVRDKVVARHLERMSP